jgi:hypothetical protein
VTNVGARRQVRVEMEPIKPKDGFDWTRVVWLAFTPINGEVCSYCEAKIPDEDVPLMLWRTPAIVGDDTVFKATFCYACMKTWFGIETFDS